jgi:hypothetical protein
MKPILHFSSLIYCRIIKSTHMAVYLMSIKPPLSLALEQLQQPFYFYYLNLNI